MIESAYITYAVAGLAAAIPIAIWLYILFKRESGERKYIFWTFAGGILAVAILMLMQKFWNRYPEYDPFRFFTSEIYDPKTFFAVTYIIVGILEEIVKQIFLRYLDTKKAIIKSVNDSIRFSLVAALGFAFAENIFYLQSTYSQYGGFTSVLLITYIFRSIFTTTGHMCFSGLFGYFYGLGRFSYQIKNEAAYEGKKFYFTRLLGFILRLPQSGLLRQKYIIEGLFTAILLHGTFNFILSLEEIIEISPQIPSLMAIVLVTLAFAYLYYLRQRKTVALELLEDVTLKEKSTIKPEQEQIVIELISQWIKEKKYQDAVSVADRLLDKDPSNMTLKFLRAKALDEFEGNNNVLKQAISSFQENPTAKNKQNDQSILAKYKEQKNKSSKVKIETTEDDTYHI